MAWTWPSCRFPCCLFVCFLSVFLLLPNCPFNLRLCVATILNYCLGLWCNVYRVVTKISNCQVNTTSRWRIKQLGISLGSIFLRFFNENRRGKTFCVWEMHIIYLTVFLGWVTYNQLHKLFQLFLLLEAALCCTEVYPSASFPPPPPNLMYYNERT